MKAAAPAHRSISTCLLVSMLLVVSTGGPLVAAKAEPAPQSSTATSTAIIPSVATITLGDTVTFTATVTAATGTPTGLVTFFDGTTPLGSGTLTSVDGMSQATFTTSLLSAAASPHSITATYQGDSVHDPSGSSPISETVNPRISTTGIILSPTTVAVGQPSTATVTLTDSGSVPPGTADVFSSTGAAATGRTGFTATLFADGLVLVAGGTAANGVTVLNSAEIYSVSGGTFTATGNLATMRTGAVAVLLPTGKVLVAGGSTNGVANGALNTAELFDPNAGTFTSTSHNMTAARFGHSAILLNTGKILIAGGANSGGVLNSAELYDPVADTFTATGNLNAARTGAAATPLGTGKVMVAGGSSDGTANGALSSAELFDPAGNSGAGTFASVAGANRTLSSLRWQPEAVLLLSGKVLIAGGQNSAGALTTADLYDPVADSFTASNRQMGQARANGTAVALPNGMVLLAGGTTSQAVDLYDGDSDRFDSTGSLQQSDSGLIATLLNSGQVLAAGITTAATPVSDAELYSPSFNPLGTVGVNSSEATDSIPGACILVPSTATASTCSSAITPVNVATSPHTITATYPADAVHSGSSHTASLTVTKASTTTTVTSSANASIFGQSVTFTATVSAVAPGSGTPTGTVTFLDGGSPVGTGTLIEGIATFTTSALAIGNHTLTTSYGGDGNFNGSTGSLTGNPQVVNKANTSTTVTSSRNPSVLGQSVTFTATVSALAPGAGTPTGTVTFLDGGSPVGTGTLSEGIATFTTSALAIGNHTLTTSYGGDGNFNGSTGSLTGNPQVVNKADTATTVTSSQNPSIFGQSVTFTATVTAVAPGAGTPTGTVTFLDGGSPIGTGTLVGGVATFATSALATGNHTLTTSYGGDATFNGSTGSLTGNPQVVNKADTATTVTSSQSPSIFGQSVTFTATVTAVAPGAGTPTGTVTFLDGGSPVGTGTLSGGIATFTTSALAVGNHTLTTSYGGNGSFNGSTGSLTGNPQVVNKTNTTTTVTSSRNPSVLGQSVTFTATVSAVAPGAGTPTGTVTFLDGGSPVGTGTLSGGIATFTTSALAVGNHTLTTSYGGDGNFNGSTGSLTGNPQVVNKANTSTTVTSSQNPSVLGQSVTFTATVSAVVPGAGTPTGTVTFLDGGSPVGTGTLSGGIATFTTSALAIGNHTLTTSYGGDGNFNGSTGSLTGNPQVVNKANSVTMLTSSLNSSALGQSVTFTATLAAAAPASGTPTGTVTFLDGGSPIGTGTLSGGVATLSTSALAAGNHTITSNYSGDANFNASNGPLTGNPQVVVAPPVIAKGFAPSVTAPNAVAAMTITITNPAVNTVALAGVAFTDAFPVGLVVATPNGLANSCGGTATASAGAGTTTLTGGSIVPGGSCTVAVHVTGSRTGTFVNSTGSVGSTNGGTGNSGSSTLTIALPPTIAKAFGASSIPLNGTTSLTLTVTNPPANTIALAGIAFTDNLPSGLQVASPSGLTGSCGGTVTAVAGSSSVSLSSGALAASGSCPISLNLVGTTPGAKNNSVTVTSTTAGQGNTANAALAVVAPPSLSKSFGALSFDLSASTSLTFTVTNPNATSSLSSIAFMDMLPAGLVVSTPNGLSGTCGGGSMTAVAGSANVSLAGATLAANSSCIFSVTVTAVAGGAQNNTTSTIASAEGGTGTAASATVTVLTADLTIAKSHIGNFKQGQTGATYSIVVSNAGAAPTVGNVTVTDTLPAPLTATAIGGTGWSCTLAILTCTRSDALAAAAGYPAITLTVNVSGTAPTSVTNTASVAGGGETNTINHTASDVTGITVVPPDFSIAFTAPGDNVKAGQQASFTFTLTPLNNVAVSTPISLTVSGLPTRSSAAFQSASVTPGLNPATDMVTIVTTQSDPYLAQNFRFREPPRGRNALSWLRLNFSNPGSVSLSATTVLSFLTVAFAWAMRKRHRAPTSFARLLLVIGILCCGAGIYGCVPAENLRKFGTPPGTYTVTITASLANGNVQHSSTLTLTVLP